MRQRIRVLHVVLNLDEGGLERLVPDIVRHTDPDRFENHVLCVQYVGRMGHSMPDHCKLHLAKGTPFLSMLWPRSLASKMREISPDVVHSHSGIWYMASRAARLAGVPRVVHTDHGRPCPDPWQNRLVDGLASRRTDVIVAVSDALAEQLARTVVADASRIQVVLNGVHTNRYRPRPDNNKIRQALLIPPEVPIIGAIGRLDPIKAYHLMIRALGRLRGEWSDGWAPVLVLAGDGPQRKDLAAMVEALHLAGAVHLLGWRNDVEDLHAAFSLFTMSSVSEGTSMSLLEAMSAGVCPVVTDVGGNAAVLGPRLSHRLVRPGDPAALARAWRAALSDPATREADARAARARACEVFGFESMIHRYERIYVGEA